MVFSVFQRIGGGTIPPLIMLVHNCCSVYVVDSEKVIAIVRLLAVAVAGTGSGLELPQ